MKHVSFILLFAASTYSIACSSGSTDTGTGGTTDQIGTGGSSLGSGGDTSAATGGAPTSGGATSTGGNTGTGGEIGTGGPLKVAYLLDVSPVGGTSVFDSLDYTAVDILVHAFATANSQQDVVGVNSDFAAYRNAGLITKAKAGNPNIRVIYSIGGAADSDPVKSLWSNPTKVNTFAANVAQRMVDWGYDGVDLDIEFPAGGSEPTYFTNLVQAVHTAVKAKNPNALVFFGISPGYYTDQFQFAQLKNYSDYAFYFCYDWDMPANGPMTSPGSNFTAIGGAKFEASCRGALNYVLGQGYPAEKLIMGMGFYSAGGTNWSNSSSTVQSDSSTPDANYMEVNVGGDWWLTPKSVAAKMAAVLSPTSSVLTGSATLAGVGYWEWGYEDPSSPVLSQAVKTEAAKY